MYTSNGQQRPMAPYTSQSSGRPNTNAMQNTGSSVYGTGFRRNVGYQPIVASTPSNNSNIGSSSISENIVQDHTPRAPFYPTFGTSFGNSNPTGSNNNNVANNSINSQNHQQRQQQNTQHHVQQQQQQQQQHDHPSMGFGTPITSKGMFMNQYPVQNTGEPSRMQNMPASVADHGDQAYGINHQQAEQQQQQQQHYPQFATPSSGGGDNNGSDASGLQNTAALQQLNRHMAQLAGNVATSVSQNELVISLLERLVSLTENLANPSHQQISHQHQIHPSSNVSSNGEAVTSQHPSTSSFHSTSPNAIQHDQNQRQQSDSIQNSGMSQLPQSQSSRGQMIQDSSSAISRETDRSVSNEDLSNGLSITFSQAPSETYSRRQNDSISRSAGTNGGSEQHISPEQVQIHSTQNQTENRQRSSNQTLQVPALNESFDDPLNFIGTPASTTFHQGDGPSERAYIQQQTRQGKGTSISHSSVDNQLRQSNTDSSDLSSAATPHSGPPRYDNGDSIMNMEDHINRIPSPVFSESIPAADVDDDFSSFDLSMNVIPRRESRRVSMRAQQQRQSLSQQYQAQAQNQIRQQQEQQKAAESELVRDAEQVEKELQPQQSEQSRPIHNRSSTNQSASANDENEENEPANPRVVLRRGRKRKAVLPRESLRPSQPAAEEEEADETQEGPDDLWLEWLEPRSPPPSKTRNVPKALYRTIKEVRLDRKAKTNRSLATIGRIPLKEYLEVGGDPEYRAVRRMARTVYNNWLEPNVRLAKQAEDRLLACFNRIEYDFPILADCEGHWKARELMLQVIDNAIDEVAFHKRKEARLLGKPAKKSGQGIPKKDSQNAKVARSTSQDQDLSRSTNGGRDDTRPAARRRVENTVRTRRSSQLPDEEEEDEEEDEEEGDEDGDEDQDESNMSNSDAIWNMTSNGAINGGRTSNGSHADWDSSHDYALLDAAPTSTADQSADYTYIPTRASYTRRGAQAAW
ncbi:uncharacterized protein FA14DRAFT_158638 [Meira miltonrushii]|uniref:Uncharacterized protein n=1 Tax=Meira miltonrushii TaxID=1280837 RepID=A0A316V2P6_9BASI|nr:uncharacterized protein FA14DRAFT_158638 [Meira miltonrushii]PWN31826.1 hypothetical protein FA14DRAFT_158638 [Meira miltonrushii]